MEALTLHVIFIFFTVVASSFHGSSPADSAGDVQPHEAQRRQSPINFGFRIIDEISDSVTQSIQGLLGVAQPEKPQKMPKTPSRFIHLNPGSAFSAQSPPPLPQTTQFPRFPTPHPALVTQPTRAAISPENSFQSQPPNQFVTAHPAGLHSNLASQVHLDVPGPVQGTSFDAHFGSHNNGFGQHNAAIPAQFGSPAGPQHLINSGPPTQVVSPNSILPLQSTQLSQNSGLKPGFESTSSSTKTSHKNPTSFGSGKSQSSVQQNGVNFISSTEKPSTSFTNVALANTGALLITGAPVTIPNSLLQLQPPNVETNAPGSRFPDSTFIQTVANPQGSSTIPHVNHQFSSPISTGAFNQEIKNISPVDSGHGNALPAHSGSISPDALRGEFSTFTNAESPGLVLKIPNSMLLSSMANDKLERPDNAEKTIIQTSDSFRDHQHTNTGHANSHSQEHFQTSDEFSLSSEKLLSQLLSTRNEGSIIPTEAVIHLNTGNSHDDPESLSFKKFPNRQLKQKFHFGGWVGVPQEKAVDSVSFPNTASSLSFVTSNVPAQAQSVVNHQSVSQEPIFIPPTELLPPHRDLNPSSAGSLGKDFIKNSPFQSIKHKDKQSSERHPSQVFQEKQKFKKQNFSSAVDFLQKGSMTLKNSQGNVANQKIMTILRPHVQGQDLKITTELDPTVFGIFQTLQPPDRENPFGQLRTNLKTPDEEFFTITLADDSVSDSLESLLLDDSTVALEHDDDTGTLSFTQVIDNANPAQVEQAQQLITAIPAINVSHLLQSDINSTHAYDTELTLKSLLSFRKKPRRIQSFDGQIGFLQEIPNHFSPSVQLNSFVTPPSIEILDFSEFNDFHNKQGPKIPPLLDFQKTFPPTTMPKLIQHTDGSLSQTKFISSNERKKRHETRFDKINGNSFRTSIPQDNIWSLNHQSPQAPRLPSTSMSPPPLPQSLNSFKNAPVLGLRAPDEFPVQALQNSPQAISPLLELSNFLAINNSQIPANFDGAFSEDGKQLLLPSVILQPPLHGPNTRITPKPEHQFGAVIPDVLRVNFGPADETPPVSVPLQLNDQSNQLLPPITSTFIANTQGQVRMNEQGTTNQNPLFQGQLANFPTIIVSQHQKPLQPQLPGNFQNPFQNAHFNQVQNSQQPQQLQNQFRQGTFTSSPGNPTQHTPNSVNNVIKTEIIPHQSGTHGTAFDFLNNPAPLLHQIPVSLGQSNVPRHENFNLFQRNNNRNNQNIDLKRIITGLDGQFSQNIQPFTREKSIGGNSITVHDSSQIRGIFRESQLVGNGNVTKSNNVTTSQSTSKQDNILSQLRQQTFRQRATPAESTTRPPILNQIQVPEKENVQRPPQFEPQSTSPPAQVTLRSFITTSTSFPRFGSIGSGINIKTISSSLPELTTKAALGRVETNSNNDQSRNLPTSIAPWSRRFRGQFMTSQPSLRLVPTEAQRLDPHSNSSSTARPQNNFVLPFTPWPTGVAHGRRLTTSSTTTKPVTTTTPVAKNGNPGISWPPIRPRFVASTTTTIQPTVTSTKPPEKSTSASIFETWLKAHQVTTTLPPSSQEPTGGPNSGNLSFEKEVPQLRSIETVKPQNLSQKRRRTYPRMRKRPSSRPGVPEYIAQETKIRPISLSPSSIQPDDSSGDADVREDELQTTTAAPTAEEEIVTQPAANATVTTAPEENDFSNEDFIFISTKTS